MKSREEYQASIFAKRDALLRKRKKHITQAVSGTAAAVLLTVSFVSVPRLSEKLPQNSETTTASEQSASKTTVHEDSLSRYHSNYDNHSKNEEAIESYSENETTTLVFKSTSGEIKNPAESSVTEKDPNTDEGGVDSAAPVEAMPSYKAESEEAAEEVITRTEVQVSYKKIAETAFSYLSEGQRAECTDKNNPEVISITSESESTYLVIFDTANGESYRIELLQSNLKLVGIYSGKEAEKTVEDTTHKPEYKGDL